MDWIVQQESSGNNSDDEITKSIDPVTAEIATNISTTTTSLDKSTINNDTIQKVEEADTNAHVDGGVNNGDVAEHIAESQHGSLETNTASLTQPNDAAIPSTSNEMKEEGNNDIHNNNNDPTQPQYEAVHPVVDNLTNENSNSALAFTSEATATTSQRINRVGTSQRHMSIQQGGIGTGGTIQTIYGRPVHVNDSNGTFPNIASVLGPYFCLGQLGKGTFSSIHKCIDMQYYHHHHREVSSTSSSSTNSNNDLQKKKRRHHVVAAKVELSSFQQSGVLESEATMLDYLYRFVQPIGTVPAYVGHYRSDKFAAILMEFLPGEDMYQIRERVMALNTAGNATTPDPSTATRRISIEDAVYLTADVMLPLLQSIHEVGVVHRDVKPSNCVRKENDENCKDFCMVDFGLSKSIIVAEDSDIADLDHPWIDGQPWMKPLHYNGTKAYYRKERTKADFRGTSMYASLRVHQGKDYCPRDDIWSLLYVFCDLVSGGLPWMSMAANRDRNACQKMKEWVHGEGTDGNKNGNDTPTTEHIDELLKGDLYHIAKYRRDRQKESKVDTELLSPVPQPLNLSLEHDKIFVLKEAFEHLAKLQFWELPDYKKIQSAIRYFKQNRTSMDAPIPLIDWSVQQPRPSKSLDHRTKHWWSNTSNAPEWVLPEDYNDRIDDCIFDDSDLVTSNVIEHDNFRTRLPIELRYHLAQLEYNQLTINDGNIPMHRALHDWMRVVLPLLHCEWNARRYEDGGHRTATDGFKRPRYLELLQQCANYAKAFNNFLSHECFYETIASSNELGDDISQMEDNHVPCIEGQSTKRRKVIVYHGTTTSTNTDLILFSKTLFGLEHAIRVEMTKKAPPPVRISFG